MRNEWIIKWNVGSDEALMRSVHMILSRKPTPNTYKFAIIKALAELTGRRRFLPSDPVAIGSCPETIPIHEVGGLVLGYYWPIVLGSRLRQSMDPASEPNVMELSREEARQCGLGPRSHLYEYRRSFPERYEAITTRCCESEGSMVQAINRLHAVTYYKVEPRLYELCSEGLLLPPASVEFFNRYSRLVEELAIRYWTRFTEQLTTAPKIMEKIEGAGGGWTDENIRKKYSRILRELWGDACFYCARTSAAAWTTIGYAVPLSYVLEDRIWNIVLSCSVCISEKGERTPPDPFVAKLVARNVDLLKILDGSKPGLGNRDLHELGHYGAEIEDHLKGLIATCRADGFGTWQGPSKNT